MSSDRTCRRGVHSLAVVKPPRWVVQPRDVAAFVELYHNPMTRDQAMRLCGFGSLTRVNTRLNRYVRGGYALRHRLEFYGQSVYTLGPAACPVVAAELGSDAETVRRQARIGDSPQFLAHALRGVDVKIALLDACSEANMAATWRTERQARHEYLVRSGGARHHHILKPDAYVRIGEGDTAAHCFVEVDLSHRSIPVMEQSMLGYVRYASMVFRETYGASGFAVLCLVPGQRRLDHLREAARKSGASMFLFTTYQRFFESGPLADIWLPPDREETIALIPAANGASSMIGTVREGAS